eukprot:5639078-Prymnesium_polylepis.1
MTRCSSSNRTQPSTMCSALTVYGLALLANSMVYSRFRYWAQCMYMPPDVADMIDADVQALVWAH